MAAKKYKFQVKVIEIEEIEGDDVPGKTIGAEKTVPLHDLNVDPMKMSELTLFQLCWEVLDGLRGGK